MREKSKRLREIIPGVASSTGYTEQEVTELIDYFYEYVKENLSNFEHAYVLIEHLGMFKLRRSKVDGFIETLDKSIEKTEKILNKQWDKPLKIRGMLENQIVKWSVAKERLGKLNNEIKEIDEEKKTHYKEKIKNYELGKS